jgi:hypothetical protein
MSGEQVGAFLVELFKLLIWATRWFFKGLYLFSRAVAKGSATIAPDATTRRDASLHALLFGAPWLLVALVVGAIVGRGSGALVGLLLGAFVGGIVAYGVMERGVAQVKAGGGAISVGEGRGTFGVPKPHLIDRSARVRHIAVFGATGSGKSTAIKNLVAQDVAAPGNPGVMVVDIKDDLVLDIAKRIPVDRQGDVVLFDPTDTAYPPALNPFAGVSAEGRTLAAAELIAALKRLYAESWGPRLEHVLRHVVLTLLETPDATLLDIARLLTDPDYRRWAVAHVTNYQVVAFWEREWLAIVGKNQSLAHVESLLNKLSIFTYPEVRNCVGQTRRGVDFRTAMDQGKILLFNLPQGTLGEDASTFLASLVVGKAQLAAQTRVNVPQQFRKPFYLFADEFQNYQTGAFDKLITEGRSMGIGVVAACQYEEQLPRELRLTLAKNCAYALQCRMVNGRYIIEVEKQQEPEALDAITVLTATPPPRTTDARTLAEIRLLARISVCRPRTEVETAIEQRLRHVPGAELSVHETVESVTPDEPPWLWPTKKRVAAEEAEA